MTLFASVTSERCNEKECYKITKRHYTENMTFDWQKYWNEYIYIEKNTGLVVRYQTTLGGNLTDYKYSFGTITDKTIAEPEVTEIEENE